MAILWIGAEDLDFTLGSLPAVITGGVTPTFRNSYARCSVAAPIGSLTVGNVFPGGAVTDCWLSCQIGQVTGFNVSQMWVGLGKAGTSNYIAVGSSASSAFKLALFKGTSGVAATELASEAGFSYSAVVNRLDMQVISFGATTTINVYYNQTLLITWTGDPRTGGITNLDSVFLMNPYADQHSVSEVMVADEDTRGFVGLVTLVPSAAGTTDDWTGAYSDVNEVRIDDATMVYTDTAALDEQFHLTNPLVGNYRVKAVGVVARATSTLGATADSVALGFNNGGTVAVGPPHLTTTGWATALEIFAQDPTTSADWLAADINALQVDLRSS